MRTAKLLVGAAMACLAALTIQAPGLARQKAGAVEPNASSRAQDKATNEALLQRRAEMARFPVDATRVESRRYAVAFLDMQIAKVRKQIRK